MTQYWSLANHTGENSDFCMMSVRPVKLSDEISVLNLIKTPEDFLTFYSQFLNEKVGQETFLYTWLSFIILTDIKSHCCRQTRRISGTEATCAVYFRCG